MGITSILSSQLAQHRGMSDLRPASTSEPPVRQEAAALGQPVPAQETQDAPQRPENGLSAVVENLNQHVQAVQRALHFTVDEDTGRTVITVTDAETDEIIRMIPPKEMLAVMRQIAQSEETSEFQGILFEVKV
jgi:flagellar protein FlaG